MPVYLPTAVVGNDDCLISLGHSAEIMGWFYPSRDHAQHIYQCMPCIYIGQPGHGTLHWAWGDEWSRRQEYVVDSTICETTLRSESLGLELRFRDIAPVHSSVLIRDITIKNLWTEPIEARLFHYADWNMDGIRTGNALTFDHAARVLVQSHRSTTLVVGGDALETWQCGKAGAEWGSNAMQDLQDGALHHQDLEIGDVNWAFGCVLNLEPGKPLRRTAIFSVGSGAAAAREAFQGAASRTPDSHTEERRLADTAWLTPGLAALQAAIDLPVPKPAPPVKAKPAGVATHAAPAATTLPLDLEQAYSRSLLSLPLLCGKEGGAVAAPEFDPEFISCGGYGYLWPRDGAEYVSGLIDAGYPQFAIRFFDWCARHQDPSGLWFQRYFLNGEVGPNWCLPPDTLQIDQVGAVLWAYGKALDHGIFNDTPAGVSGTVENTAHRKMIRSAADYLISRLTDKGVHSNAFDTWETFIGSFTYSNSAIYAALKTAAHVLNEPVYSNAAARVKKGVLTHFVENGCLTRGFNAAGDPDRTIDSSALGAIEPFGLLDLNDPPDLKIAEATLAEIRSRLECDWEGGRAIRRFEWDAYVGGVPACVNTLWLARCCLLTANRLDELNRSSDAAKLTDQAQVYLSTVLKRATPTGLLPELMQGPTGQRYWAAPHGWAMASFVSGVLLLAKRRS